MKIWVLFVVLVVAGCASAPPAPTANPNKQTCYDFAAHTKTLLGYVEKGGNVDDFTEGLNAIDAAGLNGEGDVKERILELVEQMPSAGDLFVYADARERANSLIEDVQRACAGDGIPINATKFVD